MKKMGKFVPCTPAGSALFQLESDTADEARLALIDDSAHMPYKGWVERYKRGYRILEEKAHGYEEITEKYPVEPVRPESAIRDTDSPR